MANEEHFELVQALGRDLQAGEISLPSLPAVVMKIRTLLEEDNSDFEAVSEIVSVDTALASKFFYMPILRITTELAKKLPISKRRSPSWVLISSKARPWHLS